MFKQTRNGGIVLLELQNDDVFEDFEIEKGELAILSGPPWKVAAIALAIQHQFDAIAVYGQDLDGVGNCNIIHSKTQKYKQGQIIPLSLAFVGRPSKWPPGLEMTSIRVPSLIKNEALEWASQQVWNDYENGNI